MSLDMTPVILFRHFVFNSRADYNLVPYSERELNVFFSPILNTITKTPRTQNMVLQNVNNPGNELLEHTR